MLDALLNRTTADLLLLFAGSAAIALAFAVILFALVRKARVRTSIKTAKGTFSINGSADEKPASPHATCPHARDIITLLTEQADMLDRVHAVESGTLKDQMIFVKAESARLRGKAQSLFLRTLKSAMQKENSNGLVAHEEYREYERALKDVAGLCTEIIETSFEENHYAQRTEQDFNRYANIKTNEVLQIVTDYLNAAYHGDVVTRELIYKENRSILEEVKSSLDKMFWNAREIAVESADKATAIRAAFQEKLKNLLS